MSRAASIVAPVRPSAAGFTLIEILVVLVIISLIAGLVGLSVLRHPGEAKVKVARVQMQTLRSALQTYHMEQGRYPSQEQGLQALCAPPALPPIPERYPADGYLASRTVPLDPWNRPYLYLVPGSSNEPYEILSYGSDGEPGGEAEAADLSSASL